MIKLVILLRKRADLTTEPFRHRHETSHARQALRHFGRLWVEYYRNPWPETPASA
jgi:hypothetical protein